MSQSAIAGSVGGAAVPETATGGGSSELDVSASTKQPPPEELQDGDTNNSLEPGEVVTPPHRRLSSSPAMKKQMLLGKTLRKTLNSHSIDAADGCEEPVKDLYELPRKENGSQETPMDEADDSEGLYSDTDSSVEDLKGVEDVQQARKEKQAEAAAAASLPQTPPTPYLGMNPLRFHMRAPPPCFDFPRMGFNPRMVRGGPRGLRPPFFSRPPRMLGGQPPSLPPVAQLPPGGGGSQGSVCNNPVRCKRPQSDLSWTTLQPAVSFTFNLVCECSSVKHKDCIQKAAKSKELAGDEKEMKAVDQEGPLRDDGMTEGSQPKVAARGKTMDRSRERDQSRGQTRESSQARGSPERAREKSKDRDLIKGKTRELGLGKSRNQTRGKSRERDPHECKTRERSRTRDHARRKTREKSEERDQARAKTAFERTRDLDQTREKARKMSQERDQSRTKSRERARAKTKDRSKSKEKHRERKDKHRTRSKEKGTESRDKSKEAIGKSEKSINNSKDKRRERSGENHSEKSKENHRERSKERSIRSSKERSPEVIPQMEVKAQKDRSRDKKESTMEPSKDRQPFERKRERSKDKPKERSRERHSMEGTQEQSREKARYSKHSGEKHGERRSRRAATPHDSFGGNSHTPYKSEASSAWEDREGTPPMTPPQQRAQTPPNSDTPKTKVFDIFADSPPRSNTAVAAVSAVSIDRSTTPPLQTAPIAPMPAKPTRKLTPLLRASEIHSRIGALLEEDDNDLHLEALLATKEQLFRRTNEYKERKEAPKEIKAEHSWYVNPFNRESVLSSERKSSSSPTGKKRTIHRNGSRRSRESEENWDRDGGEREGDGFKEVSIKIEKDLTPPPPQRTFTVTRVKVERNVTPPIRATNRERDRDRDQEVLVRNGAVAANAPPPPEKEQESPDTDDYIDNWENDDSISSMPKNAASATPTPALAPTFAPASLNVTPLPPPAAQPDDDDEEDEDDSNALWNTNSTPPPRAKADDLPMSNIHELYDKFMNSIEMADGELGEETVKNSSLSNSTGEESSSGSDTSSTSSSSSDSDDDSSSDEEEDDNENFSGEESASATGASKLQSDDQPGKEHQQKKNNVSKDLRKLKSLEDNLARIQMMRENYDAGDEISEELLKMESIFLMQRNAIMDKYRKQELKSNASEDQQHHHQQQQQQQQMEATQVEAPAEQGSPAPVNSIFDANRGAIKMTISRLKLTSKSAIFDKDETEQQPALSSLPVEPPKLSLPPLKPAKEVAIVKPTIVESRSKPRVLRSPPLGASASGNRRRSRSRSISRNRSKRRHLRPSRTPSPRRWRPPSPRRGSRFVKRSSGGSAATKIGRSHSRSLSRSRSRSRSPHRRRRPPPTLGSRSRRSLSPNPIKVAGPRSPPHPRLRRSLSRERERERDRDRCSRSPLPFKPPSPPMQRSWSHSRSPTRRRTRSRSTSPQFRSPTDGGRSFADYFEESQGMEAAAYYYNMSLMQQEAQQDPMGTGYDAYAAYIDSYNMEQAYAQFNEGYSHMYGDYPGEMMGSSAFPQLVGSSVLRELPMAPVVPVAVQKGNVLEIVPTGEAMAVQDVSLMPLPAEEPLEDESKPRRKRVNFVDNVLPNNESDDEDRAVVTMAVERALCQYQEHRSQAAARLQQIRDELLALPPPPPPLAPKPANLDKPVLVLKKPKFRYFHYDPLKGAIVKTHSPILRPNNFRPPIDPKQFEMLRKAGRLPGFMRQRPPNIPAHVDPATRAAMHKEFFSNHPPPSLPMTMFTPDGMPYYINGPPPMPAGASMSPVPLAMGPQPIPVLGSHGYLGYAQPSPVPVPVPVPPVVLPPLDASIPAPPVSTPPAAMIAPFFTPPPLPELLPILPDLPTQFSLCSVPTITEILPVDILEQLGPLPKTLDLDDGEGLSPEMDSKETETEADLEAEAHSETKPLAEQQAVVETQAQLLVETQ